MQTKKRRFPSADPRSGVIQLPHVPITLTYQGQSQFILALLEGVSKVLLCSRGCQKNTFSKKAPDIFSMKKTLCFDTTVSHRHTSPLELLPRGSNLNRRLRQFPPDNRLLSQPVHHQTAHGCINPRFTGFRELFIVRTQPSRPLARHFGRR